MYPIISDVSMPLADLAVSVPNLKSNLIRILRKALTECRAQGIAAVVPVDDLAEAAAFPRQYPKDAPPEVVDGRTPFAANHYALIVRVARQVGWKVKQKRFSPKAGKVVSVVIANVTHREAIIDVTRDE